MTPEAQKPRVLVVGGRGYLGRRTAAALRRIEGIEVATASRDGKGADVTLDILDSASRPALKGFDFVVNCSDGLVAAPDRAAEYCMRTGAVWIETSADTGVLDRLHAFATDVPAPTGSVVLGVGVFPGLTNLLAAKLHAAHPDAQRLEVAVRYSPFSGAGPGVCRLMVEVLSRRAERYEHGARVTDPPMVTGGTFPFGLSERAVLGVGLPEALLLHWSTGVPSTGAFLATVPPLPVALQRVMALLGPWHLLALRPLGALATLSLRVVRGGVFRPLRSGVQISAAVDRPEGETPPEQRAALRVNDGFQAAAFNVAATVALLAERERPAPGAHVVDALLGLDDVVARMRALAGNDLRIE